MKLSVMDERAEELLSSGKRRNTKETKLLGGCMLSVSKPTCLCSGCFFNHHVPFRYLKLINEC